ncbi:hypothetical protein I4U23_022090 [Adineta vaga]|nr:hypothetical protein I4U23_022090 [Adineta vaga]
MYFNTKWRQRAITVAGGYGEGNQLNQLNEPLDIYIDGEFIYIADAGNHRIIRFTPTVDDGQIVAGGNGRGNKINQLNRPANVIVDRTDNSLIIFDSMNERVMRWSLANNRTYGEVIISKIKCSGITMDKDGSIYAFDLSEYVIRRWRKGENNGTIITDVYKHSKFFNSFKYGNIFVDNDHSLYVMKYERKTNNDPHDSYEWCRSYVDKWTTNDGKWIPIIDNGSYEKFNNKSIMATALLVDELDDIYVVDSDNGRVIRWSEDGSIGRVIVGEGVNGGEANQLNHPSGIAFDHKGNLMVADRSNHRIQKFEIDRN